MSKQILIADDDSAVAVTLQILLEEEGYSTNLARTVEEVKFYVKKHAFDLVLLDMNYDLDTTSGQEGLCLIEFIKDTNPQLPIVAMTGWSSVQLSVNAMQKGAGDFVEKPWNNERLLSIVHNQLKLAESQQREQKLSTENKILRESIESNDQYLAKDESSANLVEMVEQVAGTDISIVIYGDNGTGKSFLAKRIHDMSERQDGPFISVNMGAIPENLFESEIFGHVKGAFTDAKSDRIGRFELAEGGTVFLDEIANIPLSQQAKLLRVLESNEFERVGSSKTQTANVRVVSATNANLEALCERKLFRTDLMYRLTGIDLTIPALKERKKDILAIADVHLKKMSDKYKKPCAAFSEEAKQVLENYDWPGNIRELQHCVERAVILSKCTAEQPYIESRALNLKGTSTMSRQEMVDDLGASELTLEEIEKKLITTRLAKHQGHALATAESLGLSRSAFYRRLEKYSLETNASKVLS